MSAPFFRWIYCYRLTFSGISPEEVYNFARGARFDCWGYSAAESSFAVFLSKKGECLLSKNARFADAIRERRACGIFPRILHYRARFGLAVGLLFCFAFFLISFGCVWDIRVEGNECYSDTYLRDSLRDAGLSLGTRVADFDRAAFVADYLAGHDELAFLSVNFRGTVAYVQVIERKTPEASGEKQGAANLVASSDAVIHSLSVKTGDPLVHSGTVVHAGDPLVSGVLEGAAGSRFVYAEGEVIGRVHHTLTLRIPRRQEKKTENGMRLCGIGIKIFEKEINIQKGASNSGVFYDTIYKNKSLYVTDTCRLPLSFTLAYAPDSVSESVSLSDAETVLLATRAMQTRLALFLQDKELLSRRLSGSFEEDFYVITCEMECLENIAVTQELSLD